MATHMPSELAHRGKNKAGRHYMPQIGLGLMVARGLQLCLYYSVYPGNPHDNRHFETIMDEMFGVAYGLYDTKQRLKIVIDKGMNSEANFSWIALSLLTQKRTARKQGYPFESKLETPRNVLFSMRTKVKANVPQWRDPETIKERYMRRCQQLHISSQFYHLSFEQLKDGLKMIFRKDPYQFSRKEAMLGKNIIITDNIDWGTREIVDASMGRWQVENRFRVSNNSATRWTPVGSYSPCLYKGPPRGKYAAFFAGIFSKSSTRNKQLYFFDKVIACLRISMPMVQRDLLTWFSKNLSL